jgi:hypothetical protein
MLQIKRDNEYKHDVHKSITKKHSEIGITDQNLSDKIFNLYINIHQDYNKGILHFIAFRDIVFGNPDIVKYFYENRSISKIILNALLEASVLCVRRLTDEGERDKPNSIIQLHKRANQIENITPTNKRKEVQEWTKKLTDKMDEIYNNNLFEKIKNFTDKVIAHNDPDFYENDVSIASTNVEEAYILIHEYIGIFTEFYRNDLQSSIVFRKHPEEIARDYKKDKNALTQKIVYGNFECECEDFLWCFYTAEKTDRIMDIIIDYVNWNSENHELPHNATHMILKILRERPY